MADEVSKPEATPAPQFSPETKEVTRRVRGTHVALDNPLNATPGVTLTYEEVIEGVGEIVKRAVQPIGKPFDPSRLIYLINPETDEFLPGMDPVPWAQVYLIMYSLMLNEYWWEHSPDLMTGRPPTVEAPTPTETPAP